MNIGLKEWLVLGAIFVLLFGIKNVPSLFGNLGKSIRSFKKGIKGEEDRPSREVEELKEKPPQSPE